MKPLITRQAYSLRLTEIANTSPLQCHALSGLSTASRVQTSWGLLLNAWAGHQMISGK